MLLLVTTHILALQEYRDLNDLEGAVAHVQGSLFLDVEFAPGQSVAADAPTVGY